MRLVVQYLLVSGVPKERYERTPLTPLILHPVEDHPIVCSMYANGQIVRPIAADGIKHGSIVSDKAKINKHGYNNPDSDKQL